MRVAVIGGTGLYALDHAEAIEMETPYGSVTVDYLKVAGREVVFLPRHGRGHAVPPHRVRYRANVDALARAKADFVIAVNVVGGLRPEASPGSFVVVDDYIDLSDRADRTFFDEEAVHVDVTEPYCPVVRRALADATREAAPGRLVEGGVYVATPGPRLETPAEVRFLRALGGTVVGMTGCPEAGLARERCLCYASLSVVVNLAAGMGEPLSARGVAEAYAKLEPDVRKVLTGAIARLPEARACACALALGGASLGA